MVFEEPGSLSNDLEEIETSTLSFQVHGRRRNGLPAQFRGGDLVAGRFQVRRFLGQGGMAQVYEAEDLELGQSVAIKVLRPDVAKDSRAAKLIKTEVLLARRVTHPNVCRIFDVFQHPPTNGNGASAGAWVVAMELLRGETLAARLRRGPLTPGEALPLVRQMTEGLAAAHAAGVAHLDLKSGNVMLVPERDGIRAVLTDFGLARRTDLPDESATGPARSLRGTPAYVAPEQVAGGEVTTAADLYALGVVVYEMVTGRLPFRGETPRATAEKRLTEPPTPPSAHAPQLEPAWEQAILRCLEREPSCRFRSATEFAAALSQRMAAGPPEPRFAWNRVALLCLPLLLLATAGLFLPMQAAERSRNAPLAFQATANSQARRFYDRGLEALRASEALPAVRSLESAVAIDPDFCLAHSALADAWLQLGYYSRAQRQSRRAVELIGNLPRKDRLWVEARYYQIHGKWEAAIQRYEALSTFFPDNVEFALSLASAQNAAGHSRESLATLEAVQHPGSTATAARVDLAEAEAAEAQADLQRQLAAATRGASRAAAFGNWRILGQARILQGRALRGRREFERAHKALEAASAAFLQAGDQAGVARATYELGATYLRTQDVVKAEEMLGKALSIFRSIGDRAGEAGVLHELGLLAFKLDRWRDTQRWLDGALAVYREIGDPRGEERTHRNLADLLRYRGHLAESARQLQQSLVLVRGFADRSAEAEVLMLLADCSRHWNLAESLQLFKEALAVCEHIEAPACSVRVGTGLGAAQGEAGDLAAAEETLVKTWRRSTTLKATEPAVLIQLRLAKVYLDQGRPEAAASLAAQVTRYFSSHEPRLRAGFAWTLLAASLEAQGRRHQADGALERARALLPISFRIDYGVQSLLIQARLLHKMGRFTEAAEVLASAEAQAAAMGSDSLRIEARLLKALISAKPQTPLDRCDSFVALEAEARAHHFGLLAMQAAAAGQTCSVARIGRI
ncbi:MAG TPA: protein kinase [Thermoanaerobaculia bacterium]|jgi:tetratricopeptide (TPR) repeat protein|nr:protein kinase [Thermoanaerobaculia bacterium]